MDGSGGTDARWGGTNDDGGVHSYGPTLVTVPPARYFAVDGAGAPGGPEFQAGIAALYGSAYRAKFAAKNAGGPNVKVSPLEGLFDAGGRRWTLLIRVPDELDEALAAEACKPGVRIEKLEEGTAAEVVHVGPYADEAPTIRRLHAFIDAQGARPRGRHHEIYVSDPGRTRPDRLRTIIRQPLVPLNRG